MAKSISLFQIEKEIYKDSKQNVAVFAGLETLK